MGKFNTYRYLVLEDVEDIKGGGRRRHNPVRKYQRLFVLLIFIGGIVFIGFYSKLFHPVLDYAAARLGYSDTMYTVIIDTTDVKTELYIYKFHKYLFGKKVCLDDETFMKSKPGLISNIYDANKNELLHGLLKQACNMIVFDKSIVTPLILRASSLPSNLPVLRIYQISNVVKEYFDYVSSLGSPFYMKQDYFGILQKPEEVIDKWVAVNYLLGNGRNLAVLDMDDDFLHLAVQLNGKDIVQNYTTYQMGPNGKVPLFTKSYPNLGLMAARLGIVMMENPMNSVHFNSSCINPIIKEHRWDYGQREYYVNGPTHPQYLNIKETWISVPSRVPIVNSSVCMNLVKKYVYKNLEMLDVPKLSKDQNLYFFGHLFEQASDIGLIDVLKGGRLSISALSKVIPTECNTPNVDQPWVCLDLIYMYVLLQRIVGNEAIYQLSTTIDDHRITWALGAAYTTLDNLMELDP